MKHTATVLMTDCVNGNGRIYPKDMMTRAIEEFQKKVKEGKAFGFLHDGNYDPLAPLDPTKASHQLTNIEMIQDRVVVDLRPLDTEAGKAVEALLKGGSVVFRTAGIGEIDKENRVSDFEITSVDAMPKHIASPLRK